MTPRRWAAPDGSILVEGEPTPTDFEGVPIPGLAEAHAYELHGAAGEVRQRFAPQRERVAEYAERYWLTLYQVVAEKLLRFECYCWEESTFDTPDASEPSVSVVLDDLKALPAPRKERRAHGPRTARRSRAGDAAPPAPRSGERRRGPPR